MPYARIIENKKRTNNNTESSYNKRIHKENRYPAAARMPTNSMISKMQEIYKENQEATSVLDFIANILK